MKEKDLVIGNEDRVHPLEKAIEHELEKGWKGFVRSIRAKNKKSNDRLFAVLDKIKGKGFTTDVRKVLKVVGGHCKIEIVRQATGMQMRDKRWESFPMIWVDQKQTSIYGDKPQGSLYVQLDEKRYLSFHYYLEK